MPGISKLFSGLIPNPWAIASREGRMTRYKLLADMAGTLIGSADPDAVLRMLVERAPEDLGLDICISYQADEDARKLRATYSVGISEELSAQAVDVPYGATLCGWVAQSRAPLVIQELVFSDDPRAMAVRSQGFRAYAGFPLLGGGGAGRLMGVLTFGSRRVDVFPESDLEFFASVAHHVAAVRERNLGRRALEESEALFRTLADSMTQFAWMAQPDGWIFWYNKRWHDYTGATLEETQGWKWRDLHHPDHVDRVVARLQHSWSTGEPWEDTFPLRGRNGEWRWFLSRALPVRDSDGRIIRWIGTNTDVTESRAAEEALRVARDDAESARREAELANLSKSKFLAAASHDLRQPMQSMLLMASVLEGQLADPASRRTLTHLQRGMDALKGLLDELLDVSRLDAGAIVPEVRDVSMAEILDGIAATYEPVARGKGLEWRLEPCDYCVRADPGLLSRILRNLVENAVRYTDSGFVSLRCAGTEDGMARIEVRDSGIGIPADHLDRIWDEFHQVANSERDRAQGTGLGLAIVRRLTDLLNIPIALHSVEGAGSVFTLSIPLTEKTESSIHGSEGDACELSQGTALVIDDDAMILIGLQSIFSLWGYRVLIAGSGEQALEQLDRSGLLPEVIVSDYRLKGGEIGTDVILRIRNRLGAQVPGIILTGEAGREADLNASVLGLGFVHKPVTPRQLASEIERATGRRPGGEGDPAPVKAVG